jgi:small-conductance mechanosensitive channel
MERHALLMWAKIVGLEYAALSHMAWIYLKFWSSKVTPFHQNIQSGFQEIIFIVSWSWPDHMGSTVYEKLVTTKWNTNEDKIVSVWIICTDFKRYSL